MNRTSFLLFAIGLLLTPLAHAADGEPFNIRFIQRDAAGNPITLDYQGTDYPNQTFGTNNLGVYGPLTLTASFVSDFASAVRAQIEGALVAGANVTITASGSGASRQYTISATGGSGGSMPDIPSGTVLARSASGTGPASAHTVVAPLVVSGNQITLPVSYQLADPILDDLVSGEISGRVILQGGYRLRGPASVDYQTMVGTTMGYPARGAEIYVATSNATLTVPATGTAGDIYYLWITSPGVQRTTSFSTPLWNGRALVPNIVTPANGDDYLALKRESDRWVIQGDPPAATGDGPFGRQEAPTFNNAILNGNTTIANLIATLLSTGSIEYEGTTDDFETTITFENPTGDRAWRFPNITSPGDVLSTAGTQTVSGKNISGSSNTITNIPLDTGTTGILSVSRGGTGTTTPGLVPGTNVTISGTWPNQTINASGGGGGSAPTIASSRQNVFLWEEFLGVGTSTSVPMGQLGFIQEGSGSAAGTPVAGSTTSPGMIQFYTGTGTTGYRGAMTSGTAAAGILFGGASYTTEFRFNVGQASDASGNYGLRFGFVDSVSSTEPTDGVYFRCSGASPVNWIAVARNNGTETASATDTGVAVATSGWVKLAITVNAAGNQALFYIDGTLVRTETANIPTASGRNTALGFSIFKASGASDRWITMDYAGLEIGLTSSR